MSSLQFDFLDLSEIEEEDYKVLISILEEKKEEVPWPSLEGSPVKDLKDEEGDDKADKKEDLDFICQAIRDESALGISFFVDGGTAEDIDPRDTPPILSSSITPPQSDSPSTLCNDQEEIVLEEEPVDIYQQAGPQPQYINQHPAMVQPMNIHVPTSGVYNIPTYPPHSGPGGVHSQVYSHMPPPPNHAHQMVPPTVHIENCHVNVSPSPYGNPHPASHGALYATPPPPPPPHHYQSAPQHPQMFQPYMLPEQPSSMPMQMKQGMDKDFDHKRHDSHNRGNFRGRGRGRGGRRRAREDHERSNSVSSDHSSYSDSGSKPHYKDNTGPAAPTLQPSLQYSQIMQYAPYMPYAVATMPRTQGFPMIPHFIGPYPGDQGHHVLAYQTQPPPATVALVADGASNHAQQQLILPHSTMQEPQQMITTHPEYIVSSSYEGTNTMDTLNCSYPCIEECNSTIDPVAPNIPLSTPSTECLANNSNINIVVTCSNNTYIVNEEENIEKNTVKDDSYVEYIENKVSNMKIEKDDTSACSNLNSSRTVAESVKIEEIVENKDTCSEVQAEIDNSAQMAQQPTKSSRSSRAKSTASNAKATEKKVQPKTQINQKPAKVLDQVPNINTDTEISDNLSNDKTSPPVTQQKVKENGVPSKSKRKSSPNNNPPKTKITDPLLLDSVSDLSFGLDTSITVYNKALAPILQPKDFVNSKIIKNEKSKTSNTTAALVNTQFAIPESNPVELVIAKPPPVKVAFEEPPKPKSVVELPPENNMTASKPPEAAWGQKKSWSQLFKPNEDFSTKQIAFVSPFNAKENESASLKDPQKEAIDLNISDNEMDKVKVGTLIKKYIPDYRPMHLQPKGLINKNYWCYVNAPLQALLACPSFFRLAKTLSKEAGYKSGNFSTPFINSVVDFVSEFNPMTPLPKQNRKEKNNKKEPEIVTGVPFEPTCVYKTLCNLKKDQFTEGRQQDAEEMLSCVLNGLHDEMVESLKLAGGLDSAQSSTIEPDLKNDDQNEWKVQGPKKKSYVTRTAHFSPSPISQIFWGQLRCVLQQAGGNTTANLQPFNTLPLDIQSPKVDTLKDALSQLVTREEISGFTCPKTNQEVTASNQVMFEDLPRVLILQLKRFIYDNGGLQKVTKRLQFTIDLEITKDLISTNSRGKFSSSQRKYRLFAIVNHEGKEANKGHYVADVYHNGYNCWLRYDDSNVKPIPEPTVLRHDPPRVPYLLFYRRSDTLSPPSSQQVNGNSAGNSSSSSSGGSSNSSVSSTCNGKN